MKTIIDYLQIAFDSIFECIAHDIRLIGTGKATYCNVEMVRMSCDMIYNLEV